MVEPSSKARRSIRTIFEVPNVRHNSPGAEKRRSIEFGNVALTPSGHGSFNEEKSQSLDLDNSLPQPGRSGLGQAFPTSTQDRSASFVRAASCSVRSRSSSLNRTVSTSAKRVINPLRRLSTMSTYSRDGSSGASSNLPSPSTPLMNDVNFTNNESKPAVTTPRPRQPSNANMQHDRISVHFDDTMARVLQLPILDGHEGGEGEEFVIDSGTEDELSLAVTLALPGQLQLLGSFVGMYAEFDGRLGDKVAGIRHVGMVGLLDGVIATIRGHVSYLAWLRKKKGQANPKRDSMEAMAADMIRLYDGGRPHLKAVLREEVDMYNSLARKAWVNRKDCVLGQILGGIITELNDLEVHDTCKDEVRKVKGAWMESWDKYAAMTSQELVAAGWMKEKVV